MSGGNSSQQCDILGKQVHVLEFSSPVQEGTKIVSCFDTVQQRSHNLESQSQCMTKKTCKKPVISIRKLVYFHFRMEVFQTFNHLD